MKISYFITILLFSSNFLNADVNKDLAKAYVIENDLKRLDAYDKIVESLGLDPSSNRKTFPVNKWRIDIETSQIDDTETVIALNEANERVHSGYKSYTPTLIVRYKEGELEAYISTDDYLGSDEIAYTVRYGKQKAQDGYANISTDSKAFFLRNPKEFINKITEVDKVLFRLTPYGENPITFTFDTAGIKEVRKEIVRVASTINKR